MKISYFIIILFAVLLISCEEREVELFSGNNQIYFEKFYMNETSPGTAESDSTVCSYFFYPDDTEDIKASLVVCLSGMPLEEDAEFKLNVIAEGTTADNNEYTIADKYIFRANNIAEDAVDITDTIEVGLHLSDRLTSLEEGVRLVVELEPGEDMDLGQAERQRAIIISTTKASKPTWWTDEVTDELLGNYSQKKYRLFLNNIDTNVEMSLQLIEDNPSRARELVMKFKNWLNQQDPKIIDEDGSEMSVKL